MGASVKKKESDNEELKGEIISFNKTSDYKAIVLKADGKTYVEHKHLADKLVKAKKATYNDKVEIEVAESDTQVLRK